MNPRERILIMALLVAVVLGGAVLLGYQFTWKPLRDRDSLQADLEKRIAAKELQVTDLQTKKKQVENWRALSLPADVHLARGEYQKLLNEMLVESGFRPGAVSVKSRELDVNLGSRTKKQPYVKLSYELSGQGNLASTVKFLERVYRTPLLHQVKSVDILKPQTVRPDQKPDELDIKLKIESLVVEGASTRQTLLPKENVPEVKVLADNPRRYADIVARNIFTAPPPLAPTQERAPPKQWEDQTRHVHLTDITYSDKRIEGHLFDRLNNRKVRLWASPGFEFPVVQDSDGNTVVHGGVVHIDPSARELVFRVELKTKEPEKLKDLVKEKKNRDRERLYRLAPAELKQLVAAKAITEDEAERVCWIRKDYWEALANDGVIRTTGKDFSLLWNLVRGKVVHAEGDDVYLRVEKKYCAYSSGQATKGKPESHEGYCLFHIGDTLREALLKPLAPSKVPGLQPPETKPTAGK